MDSMKDYEVYLLLDNIQYSEKNDWERSRFESYVVAQVNSKKKIKPTDLVKFSWDKEYNDKPSTEISTQDIERLKKKSEEIIKQNKLKENAK
jgi:hypothetical protein